MADTQQMLQTYKLVKSLGGNLSFREMWKISRKNKLSFIDTLAGWFEWWWVRCQMKQARKWFKSQGIDPDSIS